MPLPSPSKLRAGAAQTQRTVPFRRGDGRRLRWKLRANIRQLEFHDRRLRLLIAAIEMLLAGLVGAAVDPATVAKAIRSGGDARRWAKAKKANIDTNPVEYLYLKELVELFEDHHLARSGEWSQQLNDSLHAVVKVRNPVMHPTGSLVMGRDAREIARTARAALDVAHALTEIARIRGSDNSKPPGGGFVE